MGRHHTKRFVPRRSRHGSLRLGGAALCCAVALLGACSSASKHAGQLSFAQVQSIQTGLTSAQIRDSFGEPSTVQRGADGRVERMEYVALDAKQSHSKLFLDFDARDVLVTKTYTGQVVRP